MNNDELIMLSCNWNDHDLADKIDDFFLKEYEIERERRAEMRAAKAATQLFDKPK